MNTGKQTSRTKKDRKVAVSAPAAKGKKVKVVEVSLSSSRTKNASTSKKAKKTSLVELKQKEARQKQAAAPVKRKLVKLEEAPQSELLPDITNPSPKILKTFRDAAKHTRKLLKEKHRAVKVSTHFLARPPMKAKGYLLDLRVHSPATNGYFSPGGVEPISAIVRLARVKGLQMIGLTDYYNPCFIDSIKTKAAEANIIVIPGVDLRCQVGGCDEIYLTAMFPESTDGATISQLLAELNVPTSARGSASYILGQPFQTVLRLIENRGGLLIPSRVDKTPYRQLAIPTLVEEYGFHAFDLVHPENPEFFKRRWPGGEFTFFSFSNANALGQIGNRAVRVKLASLGFEGLRERIQRRAPQIA